MYSAASKPSLCDPIQSTVILLKYYNFKKIAYVFFFYYYNVNNKRHCLIRLNFSSTKRCQQKISHKCNVNGNYSTQMKVWFQGEYKMDSFTKKN